MMNQAIIIIRGGVLVSFVFSSFAIRAQISSTYCLVLFFLIAFIFFQLLSS